MDLLSASMQYAAVGFILVLATAFFFKPTGLVKWVQKKNYQYEVTFALYMMTPTEKFIFNSVLFLTVSMLLTASILYLPNHIVTISRRAFYYFAGDTSLGDASRTAATQLGDTASKASEVVLGAATGLAEAAYEAAVHTAAVAQDAMTQAADTLGWN